MPKSASSAAVMQTQERSPSLARMAVALVSKQGRDIGKYWASGKSIGGEYSEDSWVKNGGVVPLSLVFSSGLASLLAIYAG